MTKVSMGIIGMGYMGQLFGRILAEMDSVELLGFADIDPEKLKIAKELKVKVYTDYRELLKLGDLQAVLICTSDQYHLEPALASAEAGKHIFIEKPLAMDVGEAKRIVEAAKRAKVKLMVGHTLRFDPRFVQAKEAVAKGEMGEIIHIFGRRTNNLFNARRLKGRTSVAWFLGVHDIDMMNWLTESNVERVSAESVRKALVDLGVDDTIYALIKYKNGTLACLETSWALPDSPVLPAYPASRIFFQIVGTEGIIAINPDNRTFSIQTKQEIKNPDTLYNVKLQGKSFGIYREEISHFIDCLLHDRKPLITGEDGLKAVIIVDAIHQALKEKKVINVPSWDQV